jgi:hypothetical protein
MTGAVLQLPYFIRTFSNSLCNAAPKLSITPPPTFFFPPDRSQRERALENKDRVDFIMLREDMADRESMMSPDPPQNDADDYSDEENPL